MVTNLRLFVAFLLAFAAAPVRASWWDPITSTIGNAIGLGQGESDAGKDAEVTSKPTATDETSDGVASLGKKEIVQTAGRAGESSHVAAAKRDARVPGESSHVAAAKRDARVPGSANKSPSEAPGARAKRGAHIAMTHEKGLHTGLAEAKPSGRMSAANMSNVAEVLAAVEGAEEEAQQAKGAIADMEASERKGTVKVEAVQRAMSVMSVMNVQGKFAAARSGPQASAVLSPLALGVFAAAAALAYSSHRIFRGPRVHEQRQEQSAFLDLEERPE